MGKKLELNHAGGSAFSARGFWVMEESGQQYTKMPPAAPVLGLWMAKAKYGLSGKVTFPFLGTDDGAIIGAFEIAEYMNGLEGSEGKMWRESEREEVADWDKAATTILIYARVLRIKAVERDPKNVLPYVPGPLKISPQIGTFIGTSLLGQIKAKYAEENAKATEEAVTASLEKIRAATVAQGKKYIVGDHFTYADMTVDTALNYMFSKIDLPIEESKVTQEEYDAFSGLAEKFKDLRKYHEVIRAEHFPEPKQS